MVSTTSLGNGKVQVELKYKGCTSMVLLTMLANNSKEFSHPAELESCNICKSSV